MRILKIRYVLKYMYCTSTCSSCRKTGEYFSLYPALNVVNSAPR